MRMVCLNQPFNQRSDLFIMGAWLNLRADSNKETNTCSCANNLSALVVSNQWFKYSKQPSLCLFVPVLPVLIWFSKLNHELQIYFKFMVVCFKYNKLSDEDKKICLEGNPLKMSCSVYVCVWFRIELWFFFFQICFLNVEWGSKQDADLQLNLNVSTIKMNWNDCKL